MSVTCSDALPIIVGGDGDLFVGDGIEGRSVQEAVGKASRLAGSHAVAVALSRSGDPTSGEFEPAAVLARFGELPPDLADLMGEPT